jgi:hypothetical protein
VTTKNGSLGLGTVPFRHGWRDLDVHYSRGYFENPWGNVKMENAVAGSGYSTVICLGNIILYPLLRNIEN